MKSDKALKELPQQIASAVAHYWETRTGQMQKQSQKGSADQGLRSAVTGGAQMDGFIQLLTGLVVAAGVPESCVYQKKAVELPGFFRPTKEWDLLVVRDGELLAAIEAKSQVGPSFGNNFNNRTEEALGSALDLWTAFREGAFASSRQPFLGYFFMLEECETSLRPVRVKEPHFEVFPEFREASYLRRYEIFCRKLVRERHYTAAAFVSSTATGGRRGEYATPANDLSPEHFARDLMAHLWGGM